MTILIALLIGLVGGISGGLFGIGGGIVIVPACVFLLGMTQKNAQGTSLLALLLPVGALGAWNYWKNGQMQVSMGLWIALGFLFGALLGSQFALNINENTLRKSFAVFLMVVALYQFFKPNTVPKPPVSPTQISATNDVR